MKRPRCNPCKVLARSGDEATMWRLYARDPLGFFPIGWTCKYGHTIIERQARRSSGEKIEILARRSARDRKARQLKMFV